MKHEITVFTMAVALVSTCAVQATTYVWNPAATAGWSDKDQYFAEDGVTPAANAPTDNDVVRIPADCTVEVSTDSDAVFVNKLHGVYLVGTNSTFVLSAPSDIQWGAAVCGNGVFVKRTAAQVELLPNKQTDLMAKYSSGGSSYYTAYRTLHGTVVEKGTLLAPQNASSGAYMFGPVTLSNDVVFAVSTNATTLVTALNGYGSVKNAANGSTTCPLVIGIDGLADFAAHCRYSHFYGTLDGAKMAIQTFGTVYLYNTGSTSAGDPRIYGRDGTEGDPRVGNLFFAGPGSLGTCSWMNLYSSAALHYLGGGTCKFNKQITYRVTKQYPIVLDGGPSGGLVFTSSIIHYNGSDSYKMGRVTLTGDGETPNVVSGKWVTAASSGGTNYTTFIAKTGSGTWRFANAASEQKGALAIRDGTLQFDSIAEQGIVSSLGTSTVLYKDVYGLQLDENKVGYAFLLGGIGTNPTFEYTGVDTAVCTTRPLALTGQGGRLAVAADAGAFDFSGVFSEDAGEKTLTLAGDSTADNVIRGISNGVGTVALAKEGTGTWSIRGTNVISGTLKVKEGTLQLCDRKKEKYNYYRLVIKDDYGNARMYINEFALYDAQGSNCVYGVKELFPDGSEEGTVAGYYNTKKVSDLQPGYALAHQASGRKYYVRASSDNGLKHLFAGDATNFDFLIDLSSYATGHPLPGKPETWYYVTIRLPENCPEIVRYDICLNATWATANNPKTVAVWASVTGADDDWDKDVCASDLDLDNASTKWAASGDSFVAGRALRPDKGAEVVSSRQEPDEGGATMLDAVTSVQIAPGATLAAIGETKTIRGITLDASAPGMGTISGCTFASEVTINVVNAGTGWKELKLPVNFSDIAGAENVTWKLALDGDVSKGKRCDLVVKDGYVTITKKGLLLIFR